MPRRLPKVPRTLPTIFGPIPVHFKVDLRSRDGQALCGRCIDGSRHVEIDANISRERAWQTYWHEWVHMTLTDAGLRVDDAITERLCDTIATARVREMLDPAIR